MLKRVLVKLLHECHLNCRIMIIIWWMRELIK
jgi:hypothetical protein